MDLITQDSKTTEMLFSSLDRVLEGVERMSANCRPALGGERYLTGEEMCEKLHVSLTQVAANRTKKNCCSVS